MTQLPANIQFDPDDSIAHNYRKQGQPIRIPGSCKTVFVYKGTVVQVPLVLVEKGLPLECQYAGWGMVHQVQGKTIQPQKHIYIVDHGLSGWISNTVYTAVFRALLMNQILRVLPPDDIICNNNNFVFVPTALQATPSCTLIKAYLKRYVIEDRQKGHPKYNSEVINKLTVQHVLVMIYKVDKKCVVCGTALLFQGYTKCHGQTFSVNHLDDSQGHYKWNVWLMCLSCNHRHKR